MIVLVCELLQMPLPFHGQPVHLQGIAIATVESFMILCLFDRVGVVGLGQDPGEEIARRTGHMADSVSFHYMTTYSHE